MEKLSSAQKEFIGLLTSHQPKLRNLCRILIPESLNDVDDVLQEVNRIILEKSDQYQTGTHFQAWVFSIARFQVMAYRQRLKRNRLLFDSDLVLQISDEAEQHSWLEMGQQSLAACLKKLSPEDRKLLDTRYRSHGNMKQYSQDTGQSLAKLKRTLARLRQQLKQCIKSRLEDVEHA